jgi:hypothetical protein
MLFRLPKRLKIWCPKTGKVWMQVRTGRPDWNSAKNESVVKRSSKLVPYKPFVVPYLFPRWFRFGNVMAAMNMKVISTEGGRSTSFRGRRMLASPKKHDEIVR